MDGRGSREFCSLMRRECLEKTELERSKFVIRNSEVGMEPTPSSDRAEQTKRRTHPFKNQNRKGRAPRQEKTNSKSFRQVQSVPPAKNHPGLPTTFDACSREKRMAKTIAAIGVANMEAHPGPFGCLAKNQPMRQPVSNVDTPI